MHDRHSRSSRSKRSRQRGLTAIEILAATAVLAVGALIAFPTLLSFFDLSQTARDENLATRDLDAAAEDLMATPFPQLTSTYVDGAAIPKYDSLHLPNERILVLYDDPDASPLGIRLLATWNDSKGRPRQEECRLTRAP